MWLFRENVLGEGSSVREITLDPEVGLYPAGYDEVADALHNDNVRIYNAIHGGGETPFSSCADRPERSVAS